MIFVVFWFVVFWFVVCHCMLMIRMDFIMMWIVVGVVVVVSFLMYVLGFLVISKFVFERVMRVYILMVNHSFKDSMLVEVNWLDIVLVVETVVKCVGLMVDVKFICMMPLRILLSLV